MKLKNYLLRTLFFCVTMLTGGGQLWAAAGDASSQYLDISKYSTINLSNTYSYTEGSSEGVLTASIFRLRSNKSSQAWLADAAQGSSKATWSASGDFKGSAYYGFDGSANDIVTFRSGKSMSFRVTNCTKVSARVNSQSSSRTIYMYIYELNSNGTARASETAVSTKSSNSGGLATLTSDALNASKVYEVYFTGSDSGNNSSVYELAFYTPLNTNLQDSSLSFETKSGSVDINDGTSFTLPTLTKTPSNATVTYAGNNSAVAEVNAETGAVTLKKKGVVKITASFNGNDTYKPSSDIFTLTVTDRNAVFNPNNLYVLKEYDFTNMPNTTLVLESSKVGKIWNQANNKTNDVFRCTNSGLESGRSGSLR